MILGIESSCDESALALFSPDQGIVGEWVNSQIPTHIEYGGVVPDIAVREHLSNFFVLLDEAEKEGRLRNSVSRIAVTCGPGLAGCLAVGLSLAKTLGLLWDVPVIGVNHLRGHALSPFLPLFPKQEDIFAAYLPHLGLLVSGGNTILFRIDEGQSIEILAETVDDAAGEALDKGGKLLGIPYPGGPILEQHAIGGDPRAFDFPRSFSDRSEMRFSFSGLKTSLLYTLEKLTDDQIKACYADLCASYQSAAIDQLVTKTKHALESSEFSSLGLSGGVANNKTLRRLLAELASEQSIRFIPANPCHTGDNAAMIAFAAHIDRECVTEDSAALTFQPSLRLT
ncbi:MAG: tRNA (adenosine(37)-N6)-threonylcarbamoyltransferase complex transferase subunit TsaD [Opitutae bacterium]|nr:tRNA (adenosine(37)-N6)-threonylcarbamoyltransferase complex transferase subunit TsaD [Opitutae bacterium]MBT4666037.1 tRNA (adenosine(37)-N6)-threonylcarbamoyltransferase complex transferase subunit TsaD [Opitutae bacterium]MBT7742301.1 tRNA (adenosine(37)-N6)-threonylcarbamoyltransferase complex transferase subunit TsaD [Opitutae bacterium]